MTQKKQTSNPIKNPARHSRAGGNLNNKDDNLKKENINSLITNNLDIWTSAIQSKSRTGRGANKTYELYGIKKLRALILDLAVRGLLVPQDPNDEPASELLKKIAAEKEQLIKEGKIKKQKKLPEVNNDEKPFELPNGWEWQRLGSIGITQTGSTPKKSDIHHYGKFIPFIKPGDIIDGRIKSYFNDGLSQIGAEQLNRIALSDSVLMVCIGTIGKCTRVDRSVTFNQQINSVTPFVKIGFYIEKVLQASFFQKAAWEKSSRTTLPILNKGKWELIPIVIAPENSQKRIVAKVDELMALCDQLEQQTDASIKAHKLLVENLLNALTQAKNHTTFQAAWQRIAEHFDTLFTTEHSIDQLKKTILQLAVMGKLVPQDPNDEPASELLKKIATEKQQLIKQGTIKKQKPLPEISEEEKLFELPVGWEWARFGNIVKFNVKLVKPEHYQDLDQVAPDSIEKGTGKLLFRRTVADSGIRGPNSLFFKGHILYSKIRPSLSKVIIAEFDGLCSADMYPLHTFIDSQYLLKMMLSEIFLIQVRISENRIKMPKLNIESLSNIIVPVAPLKMQNDIVKLIEEYEQLCDQLYFKITKIKKIQTKIADTLTKL